MNLPVIDKNQVVDFTRLRDQFTETFNKWVSLGCPDGRVTFPVLSQPNTNTKLSKTTDRTTGFKIYSIFLAPANLSGYEMCLWRSQECTSLCLNCSGKGGMNSVQNARIRKTQLLVEHPHDFFWSLLCEMQKADDSCRVSVPVLRLNGTSDIPWDFVAPQLFTHFKKWKFYDYTKSLARAKEQPWDNTYSFSGKNWEQCEHLLQRKEARVAMVFNTKRGKPLPMYWEGYKVIDGDKDDLRFLDPKGVIVGLRYKRLTKGNNDIETSDFVVKVD